MPLAQTIARRIRSSVRRRAESLLDRVGLGADARPSAPARSVQATANVAPVAAAPAPVEARPEVALDAVGEPLFSREAVLAVFEDMVRPALQADGGDLELVKIDGPDIYVRLVGACQTCPSSIITMQQGIERLLKEEFEGFGRLIRVDDGA